MINRCDRIAGRVTPCLVELRSSHRIIAKFVVLDIGGRKHERFGFNKSTGFCEVSPIVHLVCDADLDLFDVQDSQSIRGDLNEKAPFTTINVNPL